MTSFEIIKDGLPNSTIIGDDAEESHLLAATKISADLKLCTNAELTIKDKLHRKFFGRDIPGEFVDELLYIQELYQKIYYGKLGQDAISFRQRGGKAEKVEQGGRTGKVPKDYSQFFIDIEQAREKYLPRLEEIEIKVNNYLLNSSTKSDFTFSSIKKFIGDCKQNLFFRP